MALIDYDAVTFPGIRIDDEGGAATFALTCREARTRIVSQPLGLRLLTEISQNAPVFPAWGGSIKIDRAKLPIEAGGGKADYDDEESFTVGLGGT